MRGAMAEAGIETEKERNHFMKHLLMTTRRPTDKTINKSNVT